MAQGKITINTDIATEVANGLATASTTLESDIIGKLSSFEALVEIGLIQSCLSKIKEQATSIANSEKQISSSIAKHLQDVVESEGKLKTDYTGRTHYGGSYTGGGSYSGSQQSVDVVEKNKDFSKVEQVLTSLSDENKIKLIRFVNFYKDRNLPLSELLFNKDKCKELYTLLKSALSSSVDLGELSIDDTHSVQKLIINMLMTSNLDYKELNGSSLISCKEYLNSIANKYQITTGDLIFDDKYSQVYKKALLDIYNNNVGNSVSDAAVNNFRNKVDAMAKEKNMTGYQLIIDSDGVIL